MIYIGIKRHRSSIHAMLTAGECEEDEEVEECELDDVYHHSAEGDLSTQIYRQPQYFYTSPPAGGRGRG